MTATVLSIAYLWQVADAADFSYRDANAAMRAMFNVSIDNATDAQIEKLTAKIRVVDAERRRAFADGEVVAIKPLATRTTSPPMTASAASKPGPASRLPLRRPVVPVKAPAPEPATSVDTCVRNSMDPTTVCLPTVSMERTPALVDTLTDEQADLMAHMSGEAAPSVMPYDPDLENVEPAPVEPEESDEPILALHPATVEVETLPEPLPEPQPVVTRRPKFLDYMDVAD